MSLFPTPGSFFGLEAGQAQTFQACGVQPDNLQLPVFFHFICSDGCIVVFMGFFPLILPFFFFLIELTTFCLLILHTPLRGRCLGGKKSSC